MAVEIRGGQIGDRRLFATRFAADRSAEALITIRGGERDHAKVAALCRGGFVARRGEVLLSPAGDVTAVVHGLGWQVQMADGIDDGGLEVEVVVERFRVQAVPEWAA